uniref:Guanine nucleotide-binding protein subunit beta-like protein n=1 Tax=Palpitomonas bilix TaxID=652834 RepID=A0A7S3DCX4_9EUKA|mmetsp:Transcript_32252/g.83744  ORF Transcript_32252/g.83744 Transcript_32252/m.83744 type:complete len:497 (+) Transcript_32252:295-1785(+)|eukprot:CAMPEP_0113898354 /NCGR_PEP_ID=MMETSP0780_2-20120614/19325_1 /TAXON_ID=652834 /ORGANISM="Palpitomonas bilix" /LENGTH=496 /DNA_ID=CAMNT_0000890193 /DNA_START=295 /DNA_END=1785 /DNA_ORIENTATION=+ /assembly_acc=CAM_ASM_000599
MQVNTRSDVGGKAEAMDYTKEAIADPVVERSFRGHKGMVTTAAFSPSMKQLASGAKDGVVMVWNFRPQLRAFRYANSKSSSRSPAGKEAASPVHKVSFSPKGDIVASGGADKAIRLWVPNVVGDCSTLKAHTGAVRDVDFGDGGATLLSASDDKTVKLWDLKKQKFLQTFNGHVNWVRSAKFAPGGAYAASGGDDKTVLVWDMQQKKSVKALKHHTARVNTVAFFPSGNLLAAASDDKSINVWDLRTFELLQHYDVGSVVNEIDVHPTGDFIISAQDDATVKIWDAREGRLFYKLHGHEGKVQTAQFSPHGDFFTTGGGDGQVMVWETKFDRSIASIKKKMAMKEKKAGSNLEEAKPEEVDAKIEEETEAEVEAEVKADAKHEGVGERVQAKKVSISEPAEDAEREVEEAPSSITREPEVNENYTEAAKEEVRPKTAPSASPANPSSSLPSTSVSGEQVMSALGTIVNQMNSLMEVVGRFDMRLETLERRMDALEK